MTWSKIGITRLAPLAMAMPLLLGMRECGDDVPLGEEDCAVEGACGDALFAPAITCWDGSTGGNTGSCVAGDDGACHWEYRDCPPPPDDCSAMECGDPPMTPLPTRCERDAMGCHWVVDDPTTCESSDCGPPPGMPTWTCEDGSVGGFTGRCGLWDDGSCQWEIVECPMTGDCAIEECCPAPDSLACTCDDGSTGCNTGRCLRNAMGTCGWEWRDCPTETISCGGLTPEPVDCGMGFFCAYAADDSCGTADAPGTCQRRPSPDECMLHDGTPVCGCDGVTYDSECAAWAAGTSVWSLGPCEPPAM